MYDYCSASSSMPLRVRASDPLVIQSSDGDAGWRFVRNTRNGGQGYMPVELIAPVHSLYAFAWYHGAISGQDANRMLLSSSSFSAHAVPFLIRDSSSSQDAMLTDSGSIFRPKQYTLSARVSSSRVLNFRLHWSPHDRQIYIQNEVRFNSLAELVDFYSRNILKFKQSPGVCMLGEPCVRGEFNADPCMYQVDWEIAHDQIRLIRKLGQGNFAEVWYGLANERTEVAVKKLLVSADPNKSKTQHTELFFKEANLMKRLSHNRLVSLYALSFDVEPFYIVMEFLSKGSLLDYLRTDKAKAELQLEGMVYIATQVIDGMKYLENEKYVHADLAARNILMDGCGNVKIADFGLTRIVERKGHTKQTKKGGVFAVKWAAPEVILSTNFSSKSDVWSFAVTVYEILTYGEVPYANFRTQQVASVILSGYRLPKPKLCSDRLYGVMLDCWKLRPEDRPTFAELESIFDTVIDLSEM